MGKNKNLSAETSMNWQHPLNPSMEEVTTIGTFVSDKMSITCCHVISSELVSQHIMAWQFQNHVKMSQLWSSPEENKNPVTFSFTAWLHVDRTMLQTRQILTPSLKWKLQIKLKYRQTHRNSEGKEEEKKQSKTPVSPSPPHQCERQITFKRQPPHLIAAQSQR